MSHHKVQTYVPASHVTRLKEELNKIITPIFATYDYVFTETAVTGSWRPLAGARPYQGEMGKIESAPEIKLEFTILSAELARVFDTIRRFHPYEKPVIEAFAVVLA